MSQRTLAGRFDMRRLAGLALLTARSILTVASLLTIAALLTVGTIGTVGTLGTGALLCILRAPFLHPPSE